MSAFAGIDGGQSATVAAIGDAVHTLARGSGPPADLVGEERGSARGVRALWTALDAACASAALAPHTRFAAIVAGISGYDEGISVVPDLSARAERVRVVHDTVIAHAGALAGAAGIVAIAGTGSVALGNTEAAAATHSRRTDRAFVRAGGWGYFFGDEGSALWIARTALRRAMTRFDRGESGALHVAALARFGVGSLREIQHAFAHGELGRPALAGFARDVLVAAAAGDRDAREIRSAAAAELADLVRTVDARLGAASWRLVSYAGGLFDEPSFVDAFGEALLEAVPHANLIAPAHDPVGGALILARRLA